MVTDAEVECVLVRFCVGRGGAVEVVAVLEVEEAIVQSICLTRKTAGKWHREQGIGGFASEVTVSGGRRGPRVIIK